MRVQDVLSDYSTRQLPKEDPKHLQMLADAIKANGHDMTKLMEMMAMLAKAIGEKSYSVEAPNVSVNFDMTPLIEAVKQIKMPEYQAPKIEMNNADVIAAIKEQQANEAQSYEFNVKRGNDGKIVSVIASPL